MNDEDLRRLFEGMVGEIRRHFDVSNEDVEREVLLLAERGCRLDEKLDRWVEHLDQKIERTAAETQAMIKFSHPELESSTH